MELTKIKSDKLAVYHVPQATSAESLTQCSLISLGILSTRTPEPVLELTHSLYADSMLIALSIKTLKSNALTVLTQFTTCLKPAKSALTAQLVLFAIVTVQTSRINASKYSTLALKVNTAQREVSMKHQPLW